MNVKCVGETPCEEKQAAFVAVLLSLHAASMNGPVWQLVKQYIACGASQHAILV